MIKKVKRLFNWKSLEKNNDLEITNIVLEAVRKLLKNTKYSVYEVNTNAIVIHEKFYITTEMELCIFDEGNCIFNKVIYKMTKKEIEEEKRIYE